ncbi:MAG: YibE/F family protein [Actinomycetia bacterium]|nr:YibE/F family protein [Actinomycetes bacterium]
MAHSHAHGPGDLHIPVRIRRVLALLIIPVVLATGIGLLVLRPQGPGPDLKAVFDQSADLVKARVVGITTETCLGSPADSPDRCQEVGVRIGEGKDKGRRVKLEMGGAAGSPTVHVGDKVLLGTDTTGGKTTYYFSDFNRDFPIALLFLLFVIASVVFGRWSGARALAALVISLLVLVWFVIPSVLHGHSPLAVAIVGSSLIMLAVLYVTGGFNTQSTVAVLGTLLSLALIAGLAWAFVIGSKLTGLADEDAVFLSAAGGSINLQGLLLGGIVIGSLGVLDDMTVTQVSAVWELRTANPRYDVRSLYRAAERIGRDHIASTVNTLVLAYAGASLPLMIFFTQSNLQLRHILTSEVIAVEVVRTLVGSIGLIASVPITTAIAAWVVTRGDDPGPGS